MKSKPNLDNIKFLLVLFAGAVAFGATAARAQDAPSNDDPNYSQDYNQNPNVPDNLDQANNNGPQDAQQDPPTRVARLSLVQGSVSFQPLGQGDWAEAARNRPVTIGDKIWSDKDSRAEIQAGEASIHLGSMTALSFLNMDDQTTQMRLTEGTIYVRVRELREGDVYEIDTPNVSFNITEAGAFRIDVNENGDGTRITAIRGAGDAAANDQSYTIHAGERGEFNGANDNITYFVGAAPEPDEFDQWANDRDVREDNSISSRYVSRDVPGYSDLDDNGSWNEEPDYGSVWYPNAVDVGWAPYSNGYWSYVGPWGWTWVGYEPWGFAPFHYGRWAFIGSRWGWCPGPYYARPIYGPAFVGFLGGGFSFGIGGGIGWFPLGFREPYHPWYHTSGVYFRNINFNNTRFRGTTFVNNRGGNFNYAYAHNVRAVTVASRTNFVNGQAIQRGSFHVNEGALRAAQVTNRAGFAPTRQSYVGAANLRGNIARPPSAVQNRAVMARTSPAAGASHLPVRTFSGASGSAAGGGFKGAGVSRAPTPGRSIENGAGSRNRPPSMQGGRPQSEMRNSPADSGGNRGQTNREQSNRGPSRNWAAQGNTTDRGQAPAGFGATSGNANRSDRPSSAGSGNNSGNARQAYSVNPRSSAQSDRPNYGSANRGSDYANGRPSSNPNSGRGYAQQQRAYSPPARPYSAPPQSQARSNSVQRGYTVQPPSRSNSAPSRSSGPSPSATPSRPSGGGSPRSGGNSSSRGSGSPHGRR